MEGISVVPTDYEWYTPSYEKLLTHKLLRTDWRVQSIDELQFRDGNATPGANMLRKMLCMVFPPAACFLNTALVPTGSVRMMEDCSGGFDFLGWRGSKQGVHAYWDMFYRISPKNHSLLADGKKGG